jgi:hypothetical protein
VPHFQAFSAPQSGERSCGHSQIRLRLCVVVALVLSRSRNRSSSSRKQ